MKKIAIVLGVFLLASCAAKNEDRLIGNPNGVAYIQNDNVSMQLAIAAKKASNAIVELAEIEKRRTPVDKAPDLNNVPRILMQPMTITWNGPLSAIVKTIANKAEYGYLEMGVKTSSPVLVQVDAVREPLVNILRDVGMQAGSRAGVVLDIDNRNIEVHYGNIK